MTNANSHFGPLRYSLTTYTVLFTNVAHHLNSNYNIPRACLLNRPPVLAMDLKSNRSGL